MPVDTLSRWEALGQARGDRGLRPLRHARLPSEAQPRVLILLISDQYPAIHEGDRPQQSPTVDPA
jgi:hypothetical protein